MRADDVLTRAVGIGHATVDTYVRQREQIAADTLNRLTIEGRYVVACQDALLRLAELCYVQVGNRYVNIDSLTWRILTAVPWRGQLVARRLAKRGREALRRNLYAGHKLEQLKLCKYVAFNVQKLTRVNNLTWTHHRYVAHLDKRRLTVDEWLTFADARRTAMRERVAEYRSR